MLNFLVSSCAFCCCCCFKFLGCCSRLPCEFALYLCCLPSFPLLMQSFSSISSPFHRFADPIFASVLRCYFRVLFAWFRVLCLVYSVFLNFLFSLFSRCCWPDFCFCVCSPSARQSQRSSFCLVACLFRCFVDFL